MKAKAKHIQCNWESDKPYYLAIEIDGITFRMSTQDYIKLNQSSTNPIDNKANELISNIIKTINAVDSIGGLDYLNNIKSLNKGFCSYKALAQCNQQ